MNKRNKILSLMIALCMSVSMIPMSVWAIEEAPQGEEQQTTIEDQGLVEEPAAEELTAVEEFTLTISEVAGNWQKAKLEWDKVEGATYSVFKDGEEIFVSPSTIGNKVSAEVTVDNACTCTFKVEASKGASTYESSKDWTFVPKMKVDKVNAYSTYNGVDLEWPALTGGVEYAIYENGVKKGQTKSTSFYVPVSDESAHVYTVRAVINGVESTEAVASAAKTKVLGIKYNLTFKSKCNLTCWTSGHKKHKRTFKKGEKLVAYEFSTGCYRYSENGHRYSIKRVRLKSVDAKGWYNSKTPYTAEEAKRYVNRRGLTSKKNTLVFVSTKSQHLYLFKRVNGQWVNDRDWIVSTGSPKTPTPTGLFKFKYKWKTHHGLRYWSACSTFSFHGKANKWKLGAPKSGGCIRNQNDQAKYIYSNYKCGTRVCIF